MAGRDEKFGDNINDSASLDKTNNSENPEKVLKNVMDEASSILNNATEVAARTFGLQNEVVDNLTGPAESEQSDNETANEKKEGEEKKKWEVFIGFSEEDFTSEELKEIKEYESLLAAKKVSVVVEEGKVSLQKGITKKVIDEKILSGNLKSDIDELLKKEFAKTEYQKMPGGQLGEMAEKLVNSDNPALKGVGALMMMMAKYNILLDVFSLTAYSEGLDDPKYNNEKFEKEEVYSLWDKLFGKKDFTGQEEVHFTPDEMRYDYPRLSTLWVWNQLFPGSKSKVVEPKSLAARLRKKVPVLGENNSTEYVSTFNEQSAEDFKSKTTPGTILFCSMETDDVEGEYGDMLGQTIVSMIVGSDGVIRYYDKKKDKVVIVNKGEVGEKFTPKAIYAPNETNLNRSVEYMNNSGNTFQAKQENNETAEVEVDDKKEKREAKENKVDNKKIDEKKDDESEELEIDAKKKEVKKSTLQEDVNDLYNHVMDTEEDSN